MSELKEYNWLMVSSPSEGVSTHDDGAAMAQRILEWLGTPEGSVADLPDWGNTLFTLKHEPTGVDLQVFAEMTIFEKLIKDVEDIDIRKVSVEFPDIDMAKVTIAYGTETLEETVIL
jgi:hypothetical protein